MTPVARKRLVNESPTGPFAEGYVFPWPEAAVPPFGAMTCCISPGEECEPDQHNQHEIAFIYRGDGQIIVGGEAWHVSQGDVVFIPRNVEHTFSNADPDRDFAFFSVWWPREEPHDNADDG
ncbi:Cupin domain-containing protein [Micromonospora citrea]|uniref:Cupin domain-containing protein n=1 Tax=Micromonospora citrea TaxID=47855 RepID=A0A1C6VXC3_9ACTN|nr:cupin domain-containing protein [Micromonospora citrea]SCL70774.1 Cupin domain-containing protein [Micromonospora citrea]